MPWKDHLDKIGIVGSFIAAACCLGLPAILSIVAACWPRLHGQRCNFASADGCIPSSDRGRYVFGV
jgi:hypothetical protein